MWRLLSELFGRSSPSSPPDQRLIGNTAFTTFRATSAFIQEVRRDLSRPHAFALERVGFITVRAASGTDGLVLLAEKYYPVADDEYVRDNTVGAMIGQEALRKALELALLLRIGVFHAHMHFPSARLWFSSTDLREQAKFVPDFFKVCPQMPHGAVVLNDKAIAGRIWTAPTQVKNIDEFNIVGARSTVKRAASDGSTDFFA